jgi:hypothetical protein
LLCIVSQKTLRTDGRRSQTCTPTLVIKPIFNRSLIFLIKNSPDQAEGYLDYLQPTHQPGGGCFYNGHPKAKDAFKVCPTPDPFLLVKGQRHTRFPGVPRTKSSILFTIKIHQIRWKVTGLPTTLDAFNAIPRRRTIIASKVIIHLREARLLAICCVLMAATEEVRLLLAKNQTAINAAETGGFYSFLRSY